MEEAEQDVTDGSSVVGATEPPVGLLLLVLNKGLLETCVVATVTF